MVQNWCKNSYIHAISSYIHTYISICSGFVISCDQILFLFFCWIVLIQHSRAAYAHSYHAFSSLARPGSPCSFPHIESANLFDHPIWSVSMYVTLGVRYSMFSVLLGLTESYHSQQQRENQLYIDIVGLYIFII